MRDGYLRATAGDGGSGATAYAAQLVILPLDEIFHRCQQEILAVIALTGLTPINVLYQALKFARGADYGTVLAQAHGLLLDNCRESLEVWTESKHDIHAVMDAMSGIHGAIHTAFQAIYNKPYRFVEPVRLIGESGLVVRMVT